MDVPIDQLVCLFRRTVTRKFDLLFSLEAGEPFGEEGAAIWREYETGTTVN